MKPHRTAMLMTKSHNCQLNSVYIGFAVVIVSSICYYLWREELSSYLAGSTILGDTRYFSVEDGNISTYMLWDIGVVDVDEDGFLDLYTVNHDFESLMLLGSSQGFSDNRMNSLGLGQDPTFGDISPLMRRDLEESVPEAFVVTFTREPIGLLMLNGTKSERSIEVRLAANSLWVHSTMGCREDISTQAVNDHFNSYVARIKCLPGGSVVLKNEPGSVPVIVSLPEDTALSEYSIGSAGVLPTAHEFSLTLRDRHGMAWEDLNRDKRTDILVTRGGLKGQIGRYPIPLHDEVFIAEDNGFRNTSELSSMEKFGCAGRRVSAVDILNRGTPDIFVSCAHGTKSVLLEVQNDRTENRIPRFKTFDAMSGLDIEGMGDYKWVDVDGDFDLDLAYLHDGYFKMLLNELGRFGSEAHVCRISQARQIATADYDNDGDFDFFVAADVDLLAMALDGSKIVQNDGGSFQCLSASMLSLPSRTYAASWVDFDMDGLTDLWVAPQGLFRNAGDGSFTNADSLRSRSTTLKLWSAPHAFLDIDNDGDRDFVGTLEKRYPRLLSTLAPPEQHSDAKLSIFKNESSTNRWLQFSFNSKSGPHYGIDVEVTSPDGGLRYRQFSGQNDSSLYSQSHYRVYFGLGSLKAVNIEVRYTNGNTLSLENVPTNQILRL